MRSIPQSHSLNYYLHESLEEIIIIIIIYYYYHYYRQQTLMCYYLIVISLVILFSYAIVIHFGTALYFYLLNNFKDMVLLSGS